MVSILGILLIILLSLFILNQYSIWRDCSKIMRISSEGRISAVPDVATLIIGVTSISTSAIEVKNQNNQKMNQIIHFIKQQNIDANQITTSEFYTYPKYNNENGQSNIVGYQADQTLTIKIHHVDQSKSILEKILEGVINNGANRIQGIQFSFSDTNKLKQLARIEAINKAKIKARELASAANLKLGEIINVYETADINSPSPVSMSFNTAQTKSISPNIEIGNQEVVESVALEFLVYH
jgi:uncharacterized protein YggE